MNVMHVNILLIYFVTYVISYTYIYTTNCQLKFI